MSKIATLLFVLCLGFTAGRITAERQHAPPGDEKSMPPGFTHQPLTVSPRSPSNGFPPFCGPVQPPPKLPPHPNGIH